jgi:hypothetical protein
MPDPARLIPYAFCNMWKLLLKRKDLEERGGHLGGGRRLERVSTGKEKVMGG